MFGHDIDDLFDDLADHHRAYDGSLEAYQRDLTEIDRILNKIIYKIENESYPDFESFIAGEDFPTRDMLLKQIIKELVNEVENG